MTRLILTIGALFISQVSLATQTIYVIGRGYENSFCNANSGFYCLDNAKRRAEADADRDARWTCEMNHRGRALTYTASYYTYCNPNYLPPNHNGTWVNCRSESRMQCEIQN